MSAALTRAERRSATAGVGDGDDAVLELDSVTKTYPAVPPVVALRRRQLHASPRRAGRDRRPVRVGQVDAAARDGHARAAELWRGADRRP